MSGSMPASFSDSAEQGSMDAAFSKRLEGVAPSGIREFFDLIIGSKDMISLGVGEPDFSTPWEIREAGIRAIEKGQTSYTSNNGLLECREAVAAYTHQKTGATYNPKSEVIITNGVSEGIDITLRAILNPGDEVIIPEPAYVCYQPLVHLAGGVPVSYNTAPYQFVPDIPSLSKLITKKTKAIILCSPNNPTGAVIPKATLAAILELAKAHSFWVLSDEIYSELCYDAPYASCVSLDGSKSHTILLSGFSKTFAMTGWRLGYVCAPESVIGRILKIHQYSALCAPIMAQYAAIHALTKAGHSVKMMKESYQDRRNLFVKKLNRAGLETALPQGAFYCFPSIKHTGLSSKEFTLRLIKEQKVAVVPGNVFGSGGEGYIRCCYAASLENLNEAIRRIELFLAAL